HGLAGRVRMGWRARYPAQVWRACRETADRARVDQRRGHEVFGRGVRSGPASRGSSHHLVIGFISRSVNWYERAGRAPRRGYPLRILPLPPGGGGNLEPFDSFALLPDSLMAFGPRPSVAGMPRSTKVRCPPWIGVPGGPTANQIAHRVRA